MKILVIGSGGREHALCMEAGAVAGSRGVRRARQSGNRAGRHMRAASRRTPRRHIGADLTVVGPEAPLVAGIVDAFRARGPADRRADARGGAAGRQQDLRKELFRAKQTFRRRGIRRGRNRRKRAGARPVRLPGGTEGRRPGRGKGVVIAHDRAEAEAALATLKGRLVIEEFLTGEEVSFIVLCDGATCCRSRRPGPQSGLRRRPGPNTGGMGAYCDCADPDRGPDAARCSTA